MGAFIVKMWAYFIAFLIWLIGGFDTLAKVLMGLMLIDYASGVYAGYKLKNLNSKRAYKNRGRNQENAAAGDHSPLSGYKPCTQGYL